MGLRQDDAHNMTKWIRLVFSAYDFFPFEKLLTMCKDEYANQQDKILRLDWLPVVNHKTRTLEKLQVLIDDVTEKIVLKLNDPDSSDCDESLHKYRSCNGRKERVLHVGLEDVILDDNMLSKKSESEPGCTGCGMSHDIAEKIFEPFFTTKE